MATSGIVIGANSSASASSGIAIGDNASAGANVVQLGPNATTTALNVGNVAVVNANGKIISANLDVTLPAEHTIVDVRTTGFSDSVKTYLVSHPTSFLMYGIPNSTQEPYIYAPCYRAEYNPARPPDYYYSLAADEGKVYYIVLNWGAQAAQRIEEHGSNTIPTALSQLSTDANHQFVSSAEKTTWNAKYAKPSTGIPKTDLASAVQTSLGRADTALQSFTETDPVWTATNTTSTSVDVFQAATTLKVGKLATNISIGNTSASHTNGIAIGKGAYGTSLQSVAIGVSANAGATGAVAIGVETNTSTPGLMSCAIGQGANATALSAVQIGTGTNSTAASLQFRNTPIVVGGKIVSANLDVPPTTTDPTGSTSDTTIPTSKAVATALAAKADGRQTQWTACGTSGLGALTYVRRTGNMVEMKCNAPNLASGYSNYTSSVTWNADTLIPTGFRPAINIENVPIRIYWANNGQSGWGVGIIYSNGHWRPVEMGTWAGSTGQNNPQYVYRVLNFYFTWITDEAFPS